MKESKGRLKSPVFNKGKEMIIVHNMKIEVIKRLFI
jgi:hypothetical protein